MFRLPSPSMCVSLVALVIALGGAGYSATGGNFLLGRSNIATTPTALSANINGRTLWLGNNSNAAGATGLGISTALTRPPMIVTSGVKVANLNADRLDGIDSVSLANRRVIPFNLEAGADGPPIPIPADRVVLIAGATLTPPAERYWGFATILSSYYPANANIVYIDRGAPEDVQVRMKDAPASM